MRAKIGVWIYGPAASQRLLVPRSTAGPVERGSGLGLGLGLNVGFGVRVKVMARVKRRVRQAETLAVHVAVMVLRAWGSAYLGSCDPSSCSLQA